MAGPTDSMSARAGGKRSETQRRWGPRKKLPGELAEFRLEDGQFLGDVLGNDFFGPESGSINGKLLSAPERQRIRAGNYPLGDNEESGRRAAHQNVPMFSLSELDFESTNDGSEAAKSNKGNSFPDKWAEKGWGGPRGSYGVPTVNDSRERIANILADKPARFEIKENPNADPSDPWYASELAGDAAIASYGPVIEREAKSSGVDPDLVKAIVYAENARGHYFGSAKALEGLDMADSILPMNINPTIWSRLGIDGGSAADYLTNIRAGITLIKRISERIDNPTPEKVASIWNYTGRELVNDFGAYVGRAYREKPWEN